MITNNHQQNKATSTKLQSYAAQRAKLISYLKQHDQITTLQARHLLAIMHPAGRVLELRRKGYEIETHWVYDTDSAGKLHKQGLYVFKGVNSHGR